MNRVLGALLVGCAMAGSAHAAVIVETPVACKRLQIRPYRSDPTLVRLRWTCPVRPAGLPLPSPTADPRGVTGNLLLTDPTGTTILGGFILPRSGWRQMGSPTNVKGYRFNGFVNGVDRTLKCRVAISASGLAANCTGFIHPALPVTYPVAVTLITVGANSDQQQYCALFGGTEQSNNATSLIRIDAPAPAACPSL